MTLEVVDSTQFGIFGITGGMSAYVDKVIGKIVGFGALENGWDFGSGRAASKDIIIKAIQVYQLGSIYGLKADVFPGPGGGINVVFYAGDHSIEIMIDPSGSFDLIHEFGTGANYEQTDFAENISLKILVEHLESLAGLTKPLWKSFAHSDSTHTTQITNDSARIYLGHSRAESLFSMLNVRIVSPRTEPATT